MLNYDQMFQEVLNKPKEEPKEITIDLRNSFTLNIEGFLRRFNELDSMSDSELVELVRATYAMVLESTVAKKDTKLAIILFNNTRYITALNNVLTNVKLTYSQRVYCNKLVYDYLRVPGDKDPTIVQLLQNLSRTVNRDIAPSLLAVGLPYELALYLALARYSSMDDYTTVKRINAHLFNLSDLELITEEKLIKIYEILYHDCMGKLFKGIMFDAYPREFLDKSTSDSSEIYSLIGLAVLTMVNTMPSNSIRNILKSYYEDHINFPGHVRFSMKLSEDYYRINDVIYQLELEGVHLP